MEFEPRQIINYYTALVGYPLTPTGSGWFKTECPFHFDPLESLHINSATGEWMCLCGHGSMHEFQRRAYSDWDETDYEIRTIISEQKLESDTGANTFDLNARNATTLNGRSTDVQP
jgi:hypothetical protein